MYENDSQLVENNILVLYILSKFNILITEKSLTEIVLSPGLVNYFSYQESLAKLTDLKLVVQFMDNDGVPLYGISDDGKIALNSMETALSAAVKSAYDDILLREKSKIESETMISAYHFTDVNGNNAVRCYIRENGNKIVDLRIPVPDKDTAVSMCEKWKNNAYEMLMQIIQVIDS